MGVYNLQKEINCFFSYKSDGRAVTGKYALYLRIEEGKEDLLLGSFPEVQDELKENKEAFLKGYKISIHELSPEIRNMLVSYEPAIPEKFLRVKKLKLCIRIHLNGT